MCMCMYIYTYIYIYIYMYIYDSIPKMQVEVVDCRLQPPVLEECIIGPGPSLGVMVNPIQPLTPKHETHLAQRSHLRARPRISPHESPLQFTAQIIILYTNLLHMLSNLAKRPGAE